MESTRCLILFAMAVMLEIAMTNGDIMVQPGFAQKNNQYEQQAQVNPENRQLHAALIDELKRFHNLQRTVKDQIVGMADPGQLQQLQQSEQLRQYQQYQQPQQLQQYQQPQQFLQYQQPQQYQQYQQPQQYQQYQQTPDEMVAWGLPNFHKQQNKRLPILYFYGTNVNTYNPFGHAGVKVKKYGFAKNANGEECVDKIIIARSVDNAGADTRVADEVHDLATEPALRESKLNGVVDLPTSDIEETADTIADKVVEARQANRVDSFSVGSLLDQFNFGSPKNPDQHHPYDATSLGARIMNTAQGVGKIIDTYVPDIMNTGRNQNKGGDKNKDAIVGSPRFNDQSIGDQANGGDQGKNPGWNMMPSSSNPKGNADRYFDGIQSIGDAARKFGSQFGYQPETPYESSYQDSNQATDQPKNQQSGNQPQNLQQSSDQSSNRQSGYQSQNPKSGDQSPNQQSGDQPQNLQQSGNQSPNRQSGYQSQNPQFGNQSRNPQSVYPAQNQKPINAPENQRFGHHHFYQHPGYQYQNPQSIYQSPYQPNYQYRPPQMANNQAQNGGSATATASAYTNSGSSNAQASSSVNNNNFNPYNYRFSNPENSQPMLQGVTRKIDQYGRAIYSAVNTFANPNTYLKNPYVQQAIGAYQQPRYWHIGY